MTLAKFISSITCRESSGISSPISYLPVTSNTPKTCNGPLRKQLSSPKSSSTPKSSSHPRQSSQRTKSLCQCRIPSPPLKSVEGSSEIMEFSEQFKPVNDLFRSVALSPESNEQNCIKSSAVEVISPGLRHELQLAFRQFDVNSDGKISAMELLAVLRSLGDAITDEEAIQVVKEVDSDGDGYIDLQEFLDMNLKSAQSPGEIATVDELKATFCIFDLDRNGSIAPDELHHVLKILGDKKCTIDDCCKMIRGVDRNGDGFVDFDEFKHMMMIC